VHLGNVFFALFLAFFLFLPLWWGYRREQASTTWRQVDVDPAGSPCWRCFWFGFSNDHPYNRERATFRPNRLLIFFTSELAVKADVLRSGGMTLVSLRSASSPTRLDALTRDGPRSCCVLAHRQRYYLIPFASSCFPRTGQAREREWVQAGCHSPQRGASSPRARDLFIR